MSNDFVGKDTNLHTEHMRGWKRGDILEASKLDEPVQFIKSAFGGVRPGRQVSGSRGANFLAKRFQVVRVEQDVIVCKPSDDPLSTSEISVAMQPELRKQVYDFDTNGGTTRTLPNGRVNKFTFLSVQKRKAINVDDETDTEIQVIIPAYVEDDIIFAMQGIEGGTGLTQDINGTLTPVNWQDMNVSGRAWAKAADQDDET